MHEVPMANNTKLFRQMTLVSYFCLLIWMPIWSLWLSANNKLSVGFVLLVYVLPLLLPIRGLVSGKPYTHAWTNFIVMFYLIHGLTSIYAVADEWFFALVELILATALFIGCSFYARLRGRELGLGIPKLKQEMADEKAYFESDTK